MWSTTTTSWGVRGAGNAMVATGLLSAARTAAIEGAQKG